MTRISLSTSSRSAPSSFLLQSLIAKEQGRGGDSSSIHRELARANRVRHGDHRAIDSTRRAGGSMDMLECWGWDGAAHPGLTCRASPWPGLFSFFIPSQSENVVWFENPKTSAREGCTFCETIFEV